MLKRSILARKQDAQTHSKNCQLKISVAVVAERRTAGIRMRVLIPSIFPVKSYLHTSPTSGRVMAFSLYPSVCSSTTIEMNGTSEGTHTPLL